MSADRGRMGGVVNQRLRWRRTAAAKWIGCHSRRYHRRLLDLAIMANQLFEGAVRLHLKTMTLKQSHV
jgi:hypothetical protein